jgi:hypothetical protein
VVGRETVKADLSIVLSLISLCASSPMSFSLSILDIRSFFASLVKRVYYQYPCQGTLETTYRIYNTYFEHAVHDAEQNSRKPEAIRRLSNLLRSFRIQTDELDSLSLFHRHLAALAFD